jgi:hypothetical protein
MKDQFMNMIFDMTRDFLNDPSNDFIVLLAALVLITWGITVAINRWDTFEQRDPEHDQPSI